MSAWTIRGLSFTIFMGTGAKVVKLTVLGQVAARSAAACASRQATVPEVERDGWFTNQAMPIMAAVGQNFSAQARGVAIWCI